MGRIGTIAWARYRVFRNRLRQTSQKIDLVVRIVLMGVGFLLAVGLAFGCAGLVANALHEGGGEDLVYVLRIVFYAAAVLAVVLPLLFEGGTHGLDVSRLRPFPVKRTALYGLVLTSSTLSIEHLLALPALLSVAVVLTLGFPGGAAAGAVVLALIVTLVIWIHTIGLFVQLVMRTRRGAETLGIVLLLGLLSISFAPLLLDTIAPDDSKVEWMSERFRPLVWIDAVLPPGLAARGATSVFLGRGLRALECVSGLVAWAAVGVVIGRRVFDRLLDGETGKRRRPEKRSVERVRRSGLLSPLLDRLPTEVRAVASKEWRYIFRSVIGRYVLLILPLLVLMMRFALSKALDSTVFGLSSGSFALYGLVAYMTLALNVFVNNAFAWEGNGVQSYFLSPASLKRVLLGKNLAVWCYGGLVCSLSIAVWYALVDRPGPVTLLNAVLLYGAAVITFTAVGNFVSVAFPAPRKIAAMNNTLPASSFLASIGSVLAVTVQSAACIFLPVLLDVPRLQTLFLVGLLGLVILAYRFTLGLAAQQMEARKEALVATLRPEA